MKMFLKKAVKYIATFVFAGLLFATLAPLSIANAGYVNGYYKSNGTYVSSYYRSNPNAYQTDNYSYKGGNSYNKSYYAPTKNYTSKWYTPSYYTQSDYFTGKSSYNSKTKSNFWNNWFK